MLVTTVLTLNQVINNIENFFVWVNKCNNLFKNNNESLAFFCKDVSFDISY